MTCSLCKGQLVPKSYNSAKVGVHMMTAMVCPRCDLAPDPPRPQTPPATARPE